MTRFKRYRQVASRTTALVAHYRRRVRAFLGRGFVSTHTRIVVDADREEGDTPIFVVGTHRSGTSLLRRVLDSHRNIACPAESFYLVHFAALVEDPKTWRGLDGMGFDDSTARSLLRKQAISFHELYRQAKGKARWADKTPQYALHLDAIDRLLQSSCVYVFIFRHPMDVAFSIWDRKWDLAEFDKDAPDRLVAVSRYVQQSLTTQLEFMRQNPSRCHAMYYDRLVNAPERELRALCVFLGEPWDEMMLDHHRVEHDFGVEDPVARGTPGFQGSFGNWRAWTPAQQTRAWDILEGVAGQLGYTAGSAAVDSEMGDAVNGLSGGEHAGSRAGHGVK